MSFVLDPSDVEFRSDMTVDLIKAQASDADVIFAARVSTAGEMSLEDLDADPARSEGLIRYLARFRHGTPFVIWGYGGSREEKIA